MVYKFNVFHIFCFQFCRLLSLDSRHPEALKTQIIHTLALEGKASDVVTMTGDLIQVDLTSICLYPYVLHCCFAEDICCYPSIWIMTLLVFSLLIQDLDLCISSIVLLSVLDDACASPGNGICPSWHK